MKKILLLGATSAIVEATAKIWATEQNSLFLVARNETRLKRIAQDLSIRGAGLVHTQVLDLNQIEEHQALIDKAIQTLGGLDIVLIGHGSLGDQKAGEKDFKVALEELYTNSISVLSLLTYLANYFESVKKGSIAVISSVAGDRGRQSNYIYGTAKASVSAFTQGLRQRLYPSDVQVLTIKPGLTDTPMTSHLQKGILWASPEYVAKKIHKSIERRRNVIYVPWFWYAIMTIVRLIPEALFKRKLL